MRDLLELRNEIDELDRKIVPLLVTRMSVAAEVAEYKKANEMPILDKDREQALLEKIKGLAADKYAEYIVDIYEQVLADSKAYQAEILESK